MSLLTENVLAKTTVTAVRLGDGWRDVTDFTIWANLFDSEVPIAGASWWELNGCKFSCPLSSILAIREGALSPVDAPLSRRVDNRLQRGMDFLKEQLLDGYPKNIKTLRQDAKAGANINSETLERAYTALGGVKPFKVKGHYCWQLAPLYEGEETPRQSELLQQLLGAE